MVAKSNCQLEERELYLAALINITLQASISLSDFKQYRHFKITLLQTPVSSEDAYPENTHLFNLYYKLSLISVSAKDVLC